MDAHLQRHVLVMNHINHGDISLDSKSLEHILLPLRQKVVDCILQLVMMCAVEGGDRFPCSVSYHIFVNHSEGWTHVPADHIGTIEDLHNYSVDFPPWPQDSLDSEL
jgi:hypothetical protein